MIYFLLDEDRRRIEIGVTWRVNSRLAHRRKAHGDNLRLLAVMAGGIPQAALIRDRFSPLLVSDGWHRIDPTLSEFIERQGTPWCGGTPKTTPEYRDRLARLAARAHLPAATLAAVALTEWAERHGHADETASQGNAALGRPPSETAAGVQATSTTCEQPLGQGSGT